MDKQYNKELDQIWYAEEKEKVLATFEVKADDGLSEAQIGQNREVFGENALPEKKRKSAFLRFLSYFNDILIYVLLVSAIISAVLGHYVDTAVILVVVVINALIGFLQENKAEKALESIKNMLSLKADVIRNGNRLQVDATTLVPGDIVLLKPGSKVPADLRLIEASNLNIEESALTGESVPTEKSVKVVDEDTSLGDRTNMAFSSTAVTTGTGKGIVVAIGEKTEIGKINQLIAEVQPLTTPLLRQTARLGKTISIAIVFVAVLVFLFGYFYRDYPAGDLLMSVIGLTVAAIPEGLPAILSIILAIGVQNMAKRKAIVRNLPSVETLGSVSVICSDKTGTLTKNEMTVKTVITCNDQFEVSGVGYAPNGKIMSNGEEVNVAENDTLTKLLICLNYCNDSELGEDEKGNWYVKGNPTDGALLTLFEKAGLKNVEIKDIATIPFDSEYKYMAILVQLGERRIIFIKGAPDRLIDIVLRENCNRSETDFNRSYWEEKILELARKGQRVIAGAYKYVPADKDTLDREDISDIILLGLVGMIDPPRKEAVEAIKVCHNAGITVKMITGDHVATAKAIGVEMGIDDGEHALEGRDIERMSDQELEEAAEKYNVFARTSPEHKLRLVTALQKRGHICAMTGDGVNDAPSLKKANVGIAMGIKGTEVTKDASEMVLADDNFSTIAAAVEEGRRVYDNLKKTILFILPTNGAESLLIIASILFGLAMPLTAVQILWVNMVTSVTISFALAFEKIEPDAMDRPPRPAKAPLLSGYFLWRIIFVSIIIGIGTLWVNLYLTDQGFDPRVVKTVTVNTIVVAQLFHLFNVRSISGFAFNRDFFSNKVAFIVSGLLVLIQLGSTYLPFMNYVLGTAPVGVGGWFYPVFVGLGVFVLVEIEKGVVRMVKKDGRV